MFYRFENDLGPFTPMVAAGEASGKRFSTYCTQYIAKVEQQLNGYITFFPKCRNDLCNEG